MELHSFLDHEHCGKQLLSDWTKNLVSSTVRFKTTPVGFKECFLNGADIIVDILQKLIYVYSRNLVLTEICDEKGRNHKYMSDWISWVAGTALLPFIGQICYFYHN